MVLENNRHSSKVHSIDFGRFFGWIFVKNNAVINNTRKRNKHSEISMMLIVFFFDICGLLYREFIPRERTITKSYYLARLHEKICHKRPELCKKPNRFCTIILCHYTDCSELKLKHVNVKTFIVFSEQHQQLLQSETFHKVRFLQRGALNNTFSTL